MKVKAISREFSRAWRSFSVRQRLTLYGFLIVSVIAIAIFWWQINTNNLIKIPASGGSLTEGIIGSPRFINPLLATTDTDRDMTALIYSGLTRPGPNNEFIPDLAESFTVSEDNLIYTFQLKPNLSWHDGEPLTAEDIVFTITRAQDPLLKSSRRAAWEGVKVEKVDDLTVKFTLKQPYGGFLSNTTLGIMPAHLWKQIPVETFSYDALNLAPIGSGPYQIKNTAKNKTDNQIHYYDLAPFKKYALGKPFINRLRIRFYENENVMIAAYHRGEIENLNAISPNTIKSLVGPKTKIVTAPLPRVFGIFFNPNQNKIFTHSEVRRALNLAIDKDAIIKNVFHNFAIPVMHPVPLETIGYADTNQPTAEANLKEAMALLENKGWTKGTDGVYQTTINKETLRLSFTISTSDAEELKAVAEQTATTWRKLGAEVNIKVFEKGDLSQDIIRPRKYEAILFGEVIGHNPDPYVFWHSSQRFDPGLNIANYASVTVDKDLEKLRTTTDQEERLALYKKINEQIIADNPAIFIYSPLFVYLTSNKVQNPNLSTITMPADRFNTIYNWHIETERVWPIFKKQTN